MGQALCDMKAAVLTNSLWMSLVWCFSKISHHSRSWGWGWGTVLPHQRQCQLFLEMYLMTSLWRAEQEPSGEGTGKTIPFASSMWLTLAGG